MFKITRPLLVLFLIAAPATALAEEDGHEALHVAHGWARASLGQNPNSVAYVTLHNKTDEVDTLESIACAAAASCALHTHIMKDNVSRMEAVGALDVAPGAHVTFKPGGHHIMMFDLKAPLKADEETALTFHFRKAGAITVTVPVLSMREAAKQTHHGDH